MMEIIGSVILTCIKQGYILKENTTVVQLSEKVYLIIIKPHVVIIKYNLSGIILFMHFI